MKKFILARRHIDGPVFLFAAFMMLLPTEASAIIFGIFAAIGIYLLVFRPRKSLARLDKTYVIATLCFSAASLAINLLNGSLPEDIRWSSYPLYYLLVIPIVIGATLVRDPLRQFVIGTRAALIVLAIWAIVETIIDPWRFGFGSNPANAAFALTFLAIVSRLDVNAPLWPLANRKFFFYLGFITVLTSQTRAVLPVFFLGMAIDAFHLLSKSNAGWRPSSRRNILASGLAFLFCMGSAWVVYPIFADRIEASIKEISTVWTQPEPGSTASASGLAIRIGQWRAAVNVIAENPLLGRGGAGLSEEIIKHSDRELNTDMTQYSFVHNFILDEAIQRGLAGLLLLLGYFGFCLQRIWRYGDASVKENVLLLLALTFSFGLLHYLLVIDRHVIFYALYFLLLTTANRGWRAPYNPKLAA